MPKPDSAAAPLPAESLREQQKRVARERILSAAADAILTDGLSDLSIPAVADAAGVSLRTVYNYFATKEALIDGISTLAEELLERRGMVDVVEELDRLPDAIRNNWPLFGAIGPLGDASSVIRVSRALARGQSSAPAANTRLDAALRDALAAELGASLDAGQIEALFLLIRGIVSSEAFYRMRQYGVSADDSAETTAWAFSTLLGALRSGELPFQG